MMKAVQFGVFVICLVSFVTSAKTKYSEDVEEGGAMEFAKKMSEVSAAEEDSYDDDEKELACRGVYCKTGRVCEVSADGEARCVCGDEEYCAGHKRQVCGSDGRFYPSHCELHRISCKEGSRLGVDHSNKRCVSTTHDIKITTDVNVPTLTTEIQTSKTLKSTSKPENVSKLTTFKVINGLKTTSKSTPTTTTTLPIMVCSPSGYNDFKDRLMSEQCQRVQQTECMNTERKKAMAVTEMFDFFDQDENKLLTLSEMDETNMETQTCSMQDFFTFEDIDEDDILNIEEFYRAFGVYDSEMSDEPLVTFTTLVTVGNALELKCDLPGSDKVIWKKMDVVIEHSDEIKIFDDNSLYIGDLQLHQMGNYSCHDHQHHSIFQTHIIIVQMPPSVTIFPTLQIIPRGSLGVLKCHVQSVPQSEVVWSRNGKVISTDLDPKHPVHLLLLENNTTLNVRTNSSDSSEYACEAKNSAGVKQKGASVTFIDELASTPASLEATESYIAFHSQGYSVYDFSHCSILHTIPHDYQVSLSNIVTFLCEKECIWGGGTLVGEELLYVNQPTLKRVVVIEVVDRITPVEVIKTNEEPVDIKYIPHLDQVWLTLCADEGYSEKKECKDKVVRVIGRASRSIQHQTVLLKDNEDVALKVDKLFLPSGENPLGEKFNSAYYTISTKVGELMVLDLISMRTTTKVDLTEEDCNPVDLAFVAIGGYLFINCRKLDSSTETNSHIILDYTTRKVVKKSDIGGGAVFVSPDSRNVLILEENGNVFSVYKLTADGRLNHLFDEYTEMQLNHVTFFESGNGYGYNAFAVSYKFNTILHLDLSVGKVTMIEGPEGSFSAKEVAWNKDNRRLAGGRLFMNKMVTSSINSITGLDARKKSIQCHWKDVNNASAIFALPLEEGGLKY